MRRLALVLVGLLGVGLLAVGFAPAATPPVARLVYLTDVGSHGGSGWDTGVAWGAGVDGSGPVKLAAGIAEAKIAPDGETVALAEPDASGTGVSLAIAPTGDPAATTLPARRLLHAKDDVSLLAWAADGSELAVEADGRLLVVDVASGVRHAIARGLILGASFSPSGRQLVYARAITDIALLDARVSSLGSAPSCSNLFVVNADGSSRHALTHDGLASGPLWGPRQIAFSRARRCARFGGGPFYPKQLWQIRPDGHGARQLTHVRLGSASDGLSATAWSDDGRRLLAEYDTPSDLGGVAPADGAWTVELPSGRARQLRVRGNFVAGAGLSHDGSTVLAAVSAVVGQLRFPADPPRVAVVTIPWSGGRPHVLVRGADSPSWTR